MSTITDRYNILLPGNCIVCGRPIGQSDGCHECQAWRRDCERRANFRLAPSTPTSNEWD